MIDEASLKALALMLGRQDNTNYQGLNSPRLADHQIGGNNQMLMQALHQLLVKAVGNPEKGIIRLRRPQNLPNGALTNPKNLPFFQD